MTDTNDSTDDSSTDDVSTDEPTTQASAVTSEFKVGGHNSKANGAGILGQNDASTGTPIGVEGAVPNATNVGYGLSTPHDARVEGSLDTTGELTVNVDGSRTLFLGSHSSSDAGNVIAGSSTNTVGNGVSGAAIGGGGATDTGSNNAVYDDYGTIAGGYNNTIGNSDGSGNARGATVAGGQNNHAKGLYATVPGGQNAHANGSWSFATGRKATADHGGAVVIGDGSTDSVTSQTGDEVRFQAGNGVVAENDLEIGGTLRRNAMTQAHIGSLQTVPSGLTVVIDFDSTSVDEPNAWSNNEYTCPDDGHYQVTLNIKFGSYSSDTNVEVYLYVNGASTYYWDTIALAGEMYERSFVRTLTGLNASDAIDARISQHSGNDKVLNYDEGGTECTVRYLGDGAS